MKVKTKTSRSALRRMAWLVPAVVAVSAFTVQTDLSAKRQGEILYILEQDCGSCHGLTMKGGLGPALTLESMQDLSVDDLVTVIMDGVPGTPMPPWRPLLSDQEALFMAQVLKTGDMVK